MKDEDKPREQLISEITELRQQLGETKSSLEEPSASFIGTEDRYGRKPPKKKGRHSTSR